MTTSIRTMVNENFFNSEDLSINSEGVLYDFEGFNHIEANNIELNPHHTCQEGSFNAHSI